MVFRKISSLIFLIALSCLSALSNDSSEEDIKELQTFLKEQEVIRVYIAGTPGNGHQSSSTELMEYLINLGFNGQFEVIWRDYDAKYEEYPVEQTIRKIRNLLPGLDPLSTAPQSYKKCKVKFIPYTKWHVNPDKYELVELGVTGGYDGHLGENPIGALNLRTHSLFQTSPPGWDFDYLSTRSPDGKVSRKVIGGIDGGIRINIPSPDDYESFLAENGVTDSSKIKNYKWLIQNSSEINFQPIYLNASAMEGNYILKLVLSNLVGHSDFKDDLKKPGMVMFLTNPLSEEMLDLINVYSVAISSNLQRSGTAVAKLSVVEIDSPDLISKIQTNSQKNTVTLVLGEYVQKNLFNFLFKKASFLPVLGGRNSQALGHNLEVPFLSSSETELYLMDFLRKLETSKKENLKNAVKSILRQYIFKSPSPVNRLPPGPRVMSLARANWSFFEEGLVMPTEYVKLIKSYLNKDSFFYQAFKNYGANFKRSDRRLKGLLKTYKQIKNRSRSIRLRLKRFLNKCIRKTTNFNFLQPSSSVQNLDLMSA